MIFFAWPLYAMIGALGVGCIELEALQANVGTICLWLNLIMYGGPVTGIIFAIMSKSTEYLPLILGATTLLCAVPWFSFGLSIDDHCIWIPNAFGIFFGLLQITTYFCIGRCYPENARSVKHVPSDGSSGIPKFCARQQRVASWGNIGFLLSQSTTELSAARSAPDLFDIIRVERPFRPAETAPGGLRVDFMGHTPTA